jgi:hypothetical protein
MAEGVPAMKGGAFRTPSTSLNGAVEKIAEAERTGGLVLTGEPAPTAGREWSAGPLREATEGERPIAVTSMSAG